MDRSDWVNLQRQVAEEKYDQLWAPLYDQKGGTYSNTSHQQFILQEMYFSEIFDGAICMDALEHICPEDWPLILQRFHQAMKSRGYFYSTVELADQADVENAFQQGKDLRLPVVYGEWINTDVYHYYSSISQVKEWLQETGFDLVEEGEGDGYHHFITRKAE